MKKFLLVGFALALLALTGCGKDQAGLPDYNLDEPVAVEVHQLATRTGHGSLQYSALVEPADRADIATKVMGRIETMPVKEGDRVGQGQLLVQLDSDEIQAKLAQVEANIAEAKAHFENAERNLKRFEALFEDKAATQKELDDVRVGYESAKARLEGARQMKQEVEELMRYLKITAPFDGLVTRRFADPGDLASPGHPILVLENTDKLEISARVPESQIHRLSVGMPLQVIFPATSADMSDRVYPATIAQLVPSADPASHQFEIKVLLDEDDPALKPGMFARIAIPQNTGESLSIPADALHRRGQLEGVFVVVDGRAQLRWVRIGDATDELIEVVSGLEPDETIIVHSDGRLRDGQKVEVRQ